MNDAGVELTYPQHRFILFREKSSLVLPLETDVTFRDSAALESFLFFFWFSSCEMKRGAKDKYHSHISCQVKFPNRCATWRRWKRHRKSAFNFLPRHNTGYKWTHTQRYFRDKRKVEGERESCDSWYCRYMSNTHTFNLLIISLIF